MADRWIIPIEMDLRKGHPVLPQAAQGLMLPKDDQAHTIELTVLSGGAPAYLSGTPMGYFERADGQTVKMRGTLTDNVVRVTLDKACYAVPGPLRCVIRVLHDLASERGISLLDLQLHVREELTDEAVLPESEIRYDVEAGRIDYLGTPFANTSGTTATTGDVRDGKKFRLADGTMATGNADFAVTVTGLSVSAELIEDEDYEIIVSGEAAT